ATETEMKEKKARVEDALHATRAAVEEGIVPGGGVALLHSQRSLDTIKSREEDEKIGVEIVRRALEEPIRMIAQNAGAEAPMAGRYYDLDAQTQETHSGEQFGGSRIRCSLFPVHRSASVRLAVAGPSIFGPMPSRERATLSRDLADFLVELSIALHKHAMYPQGHPSLQPAAAAVTRRAALLLEDRATLSLGVARDRRGVV